MNKRIMLSAIIMTMILSGLWRAVFYKKYQLLAENRENVHEHFVPHQLPIAPPPSGPVVERVVISSAQLWRPIQEQVKDTVVQICSQIVAIDLLQPYKTPGQGTAYGSGFFIKREMEGASEESSIFIVTNAHVVNQAKTIWIQIPSLGKRIMDVELVGMSPERDLALLRLTKESYGIIMQELGHVPFLELGDSDTILRSDEVLALGYPLGQHSLKSTTGVISGFERNYIQMSAAINPGSSGGPLLNSQGKVIGINSAGVTEAQNVGYAILINHLKLVFEDLLENLILRKPVLGVFFNNGSNELVKYLGNPLPGGCYVRGILPGSTLEKAGIMRDDMIYEINGHTIDMFGEMRVPWSEDKVSIVDYVGRLRVDEEIHLVVYRKGKRMEFKVIHNALAQQAIRRIYPGYEPIDYEIIGGMVVQELTMNLISLLIENATGLSEYVDFKNQTKPVLVITHLFPGSPILRSQVLMIGATLEEVNGQKVETLADLRRICKESVGNPFLTISARDNVARTPASTFVVLDYQKIIRGEIESARDFRYQMTDLLKELVSLVRADAIASNTQMEG